MAIRFSAAAGAGVSMETGGLGASAAGGGATGATGSADFSVGGAGLAASGGGAAGFSTLEGGITTTAAGRATLCGVIMRGVCAGFSGAGGSAADAAGFWAAGATGFATTGGFAGAAGFGGSAAFGRAGGAGCAACSFSSVIALSTSPGLEIFDRSIFGLCSSTVFAADLDAWCCPAKNFFTRSASSASMELECVFFSVTPTFGSASRISLLLTSSSLARSLIRIFIRPLFPPSSRQPR